MVFIRIPSGLTNNRYERVMSDGPGGESGVIDKVEQLLWVTDVDETFHGQVKSQRLVLR